VYVKNNGPKPPPPPPNTARGALAYLKHDALGPAGDACIMIFNPGAAQKVTVNLTGLPPQLLGGSVVPHDLLDPSNATGPALAAAWTVAMAAGEVKAFGGFTLSAFAPRLGKKAECKADDGYASVAASTTLQGCFLECRNDFKCSNVFLDYVEMANTYLDAAPPVKCTLLGPIADPSTGCKQGTGTLVKRLDGGRPL